MRSLNATGIPSVLVGNTDGLALKTFAAGSNPQVTLDPAWLPFDAYADEIAGFSSQGPSIDASIKPDVVAVGTDLYTATQIYDPNGDMYQLDRLYGRERHQLFSGLGRRRGGTGQAGQPRLHLGGHQVGVGQHG